MLTRIVTVYCCDSLDRRMLLCEEVVALCCSAACNVMTSLIVNVTYVGNALTSNDVP